MAEAPDGGEDLVGGLLRAGGVLPVDWSWSGVIGKGVKAFGGGGIVPVTARIPGITYNIDKVKGAVVPQTMAAFAASKHPIATTAYPASLFIYGQPEFWGEQKATAFVQTLLKNADGIINCGQTERLLSGEFDMFAPNCGVEETVAKAKKGALTGYVVPHDAPVLAYLYLAIPNSAPHKATAQLFADYMLTREAQVTLYKYEATDPHKLPGSETAKIVKAEEVKGTKFVKVDVDYSTQHAESLQRLRAAFQPLLQKH